MNYLKMQQRISLNLDKDIPKLIADMINEVREDVSTDHLFTFLNTTKNIPLVGATYSYKIDAAATTSRYSGVLLNIRYDDNVVTTPVRLSFYTIEKFDFLYPTQEAGEPTAYTIKGDSFIVNKIPATVTSKSFTTNYFMLPDKLVNDHDETYMEKRYYQFIIAKVCEKVYLEYLREGKDSAFWSSYWTAEAKKQKSKLVLNESMFIDPQSTINVGGL